MRSPGADAGIAAPVAATPVAAAPVDASPIDDGVVCQAPDVVHAGRHGAEVLVYDVESRQAHWVSTQEAELLRHCRVVRTMQEQARVVTRLGVHFGGDVQLRSDLHGLVGRGLLRVIASAPPRPRAEPDIAAPARVTVVGIITRDRPDCLDRCLTALLDNLREAARGVRVVICDDSRQPDHRRRTGAAIAAARRRGDVAIDLVTPQSRAHAAGELSRECGMPVRLADWALRGVWPSQTTIGANRNALMLAAAGEVFVSLDDDVVCRFVRAEGSTAAPRFSSAYEACDYWFYPTREELLRSVRLEDANLLAIHEALLNADASTLLDETGAGAGVAPLELRRLKQNGAVRVTQLGMAGDTGMGNPFWLDLDGPSRERLLSSEATYRASFTSREVVRVASSPQISTGTFFMTACVGLDNRIALPPFVPVMRSSDYVFGAMIRMLWPGALLGHAPFAILHAPAKTRRFSPSALVDGVARLSLAELLALTLTSCPLLDAEPEGAPRYEKIGRHLQSISALPLDDLVELLRMLAWRRVCRTLEHLTRTLDRHRGEPSFWADDLRRLIGAVREQSLTPRYIIPLELQTHTTAEALAAVRASLRDFGDLLIAWPAMTSAMRSGRIPILEPPV
jgi:hypothetical protein